MIAAWMLYCIGIAVAFVVVGETLERALYLTGRATRWAWVVALVGSALVPAAAWFRPSAFGALPVPLAQPAITGIGDPLDAQHLAGAPPAPTRSLSLGDLDVALTWAWGLSAGAVALALLGAGLRLAAWRRRWRVTTLDGRTVLVSDDVGPAVIGVWRPQVVLPAWALELRSGERRLMLLHEDEHLRAHDPWLRAAGAALVVLAPWNPALWWQVRRLRLAVEMDCDARVLARGGDTPEYAELLLRVGQRRARLPLGAPALGEPISFLGRRIRRMVTVLPRRRWSGAAVTLGIAVAAFVTACEAPRPVPSEPRREIRAAPTSGSARTRLADSVAWTVRDASGSVIAQGTLLLAPGDTVLDAPTLAHRIPGYDTLPVNNILLRSAGRVPTLTVVKGPSPAEFQGFVSQGDWVRTVAREYHPEVFAQPRPGAAIALVFDPPGHVIGHAAGVREPHDADCLAVVRRLVPAYASRRLSQSGCADAGSVGQAGDVVVYWMLLARDAGDDAMLMDSAQ